MAHLTEAQTRNLHGHINKNHEISQQEGSSLARDFNQRYPEHDEALLTCLQLLQNYKINEQWYR